MRRKKMKATALSGASLIGLPCMFDVKFRKVPMYGVIKGLQVRRDGSKRFSVLPDGLERLRWVRPEQMRICSPLPNPNLPRRSP